MSSTLFACSRCYSRHPFEELSAGQQLCKACRTTYPIVKCTYCRTEFQQVSKSTTNPTCTKCEANVKAHGPPQSCVYCNIIAAFIGNKCQRCNNSEKKFGLPVNCEQCKMQCAWDRGVGEKVEGKLLCWLCTLSYKRALARSKSSEKMSGSGNKMKRKHSTPHHTHSTSSNTGHPHSHHHTHPHHTHHHLDKRPHRPDVTKNEQQQSGAGGGSSSPVQQKAKETKTVNIEDHHSNSDQVVQLTQLREQISVLTRQVGLKDKELLGKDRQITDLKAQNFRTESELRAKLTQAQRDYEAKVQNMTQKLKSLQKELAVKNKLVLKNKSSLTIVGRNSNNNSPSIIAKETEGNSSDGSKSD